MRKEGKIRGEGPLDRGNPNNLEVLGSDGIWYPIDKKVDMGHLRDAVEYWNSEGRFHGSKSPEVRKWMLNPNNYELQPQNINRSEGGRLGHEQRYLPPEPKLPGAR